MLKNAMNSPEELESLDARIVATLELAPAPDIPHDFSATIAARAFPYATLALTPKRYGHTAAMVCFGLLLALILAFARASASSTLLISLETIFCAQFALLAVWLVTWKLRHLPGKFF
jgi:hypothetical protein